MGFFSSLKKGFSDFIDHRIIGKSTVTVNNTSTVDAERIKADAQIRLNELEQANKIRLAEMDAERLEAWRAAQLEFIQAQALAKIAIDKARTEGLTTVAEQFVVLQEKMSYFAQKRTALIESGSLQVITDIERHYDDISDEISAKRDKYNRETLPELLALMGQFAAGSDERALYMEQIRNDMAAQQHFLRTQTDALKERQNSVLQSFLASKASISEQLDNIALLLIEKSLPQAQSTVRALPGAETEALPPAE